LGGKLAGKRVKARAQGGCARQGQKKERVGRWEGKKYHRKSKNYPSPGKRAAKG